MEWSLLKANWFYKGKISETSLALFTWKYRLFLPHQQTLFLVHKTRGESVYVIIFAQYTYHRFFFAIIREVIMSACVWQSVLYGHPECHDLEPGRSYVRPTRAIFPVLFITDFGCFKIVKPVFAVRRRTCPVGGPLFRDVMRWIFTKLPVAKLEKNAKF